MVCFLHWGALRSTIREQVAVEPQFLFIFVYLLLKYEKLTMRCSKTSVFLEPTKAARPLSSHVVAEKDESETPAQKLREVQSAWSSTRMCMLRTSITFCARQFNSIAISLPNNNNTMNLPQADISFRSSQKDVLKGPKLTLRNGCTTTKSMCF
jgi:hypothetical protein